MRICPNPRTAALLAMAVLATPVQAVERSDTGYGDVLLFPYFSAREDTTSLLTIALQDQVSHVRKGAAVRVAARFPETQDGVRPDPLLVDIILQPNDSWVAALGEFSGAAYLVTPDASCARFGSGGLMIGESHSQDGQGLIGPLAADEGWIEVYELGTIASNVVPAALWQDCAALWSMLDPLQLDEWLEPPAGRLRGSLQLLELDQAANYTLAPVALRAFRDHPMFATVAEDRPTLADVSPAIARVRLPQGGVRESTFAAHPVDAVSAVLMDAGWEHDFTTESAIGAVTDLIVTLPTRAWYLDGADTRAPFAAHPHIAPDGAAEIRARVFDRDGGGFLSHALPSAKCTPPPQNVPTGPKLDSDLVVLEFGESGLLGSAAGRTLLQWDTQPSVSCNPHPQPLWQGPDAGRYSIRFDRAPELGIGRLISDEGHVFLGQPVLGAVLTRVIWDQAFGTAVRFSYGLTQPIARITQYADAGEE